MLKRIKEFFKRTTMSPEEKYLAESVDLVDLENRMKQLKHKGIWI